MSARCLRIAGWLAALLPLGAWAQSNYLGVLKPPRAGLETPVGLYSFSTPLAGLSPGLEGDGGRRLKLGYKYSRYFSVEGELVDTGRATWEPFASPGNLVPSFRSTGFGVDTVATLPLWRFSFYGKLGAYRGEGRSGFSPYAATLISDPTFRGTRLRAGLGLRYDFTQSLGVHAELERQSPLGSSFNAESEADTVSVGVRWRF